jgi:hypothetical protein
LALLAVRPLLADWQRQARPLRAGDALVAIGIFGIVSQTLLPDRLIGRVAAAELRGVRVELLDFRGQPVSTSGTVDTQTGEFIAYYSPAWYGRARTLRISAPECKPADHAIPRSRLETESSWDFPCEQP